MAASNRSAWSAEGLRMVCVVVACLGPPAAVWGQATDEERAMAETRHVEHLHEALAGMEQGIGALAALERHDAREMLEKIAADLRREIARHRDRERGAREREGGERAVARRQIEALHLALAAFRKAEKMDALELIERAIHARELGLAGRRDPKAREIRSRAPNREQIVELLVAAERLYRQWDAHERADELSRLTEELWSRRARARDRDRPREGARRRAALEQLEIMRTGVPALLEAGRRDTAELLERAIRAREVVLEGRRDEEARMIRDRAPDLGQQVEILRYAAQLWREFGHEAKAERLDGLAGEMWSDRPQRGERGPRVREREAAARRLEEIHARLEELQRAIDALRGELESLQRPQPERSRR